MPKRIASLFSGCGGLDLGFTGGFNFRGHDYNRLDTNGKTKRNERCFLSIRYALFYLLSCFFILRIIPTLLLKVVLKKHHSKHDSLLLHCE